MTTRNGSAGRLLALLGVALILASVGGALLIYGFTVAGGYVTLAWDGGPRSLPALRPMLYQAEAIMIAACVCLVASTAFAVTAAIASLTSFAVD